MFKPVCIVSALLVAAIASLSFPPTKQVNAEPPAAASAPQTVGAVGDGKLIQKVVARRLAADKVSSEEGISFRAALRLIDRIDAKATPEQLAAASGLTAADHQGGLFSETTAHALVVKSGVKLPVNATVGAIGDGTFLKWLFSEDGRAAVLAWAAEIVKIVAILAPLFAWNNQPADLLALPHVLFCMLADNPPKELWIAFLRSRGHDIAA